VKGMYDGCNTIGVVDGRRRVVAFVPGPRTDGGVSSRFGDTLSDSTGPAPTFSASQNIVFAVVRLHHTAPPRPLSNQSSCFINSTTIQSSPFAAVSHSEPLAPQSSTFLLFPLPPSVSSTVSSIPHHLPTMQPYSNINSTNLCNNNNNNFVTVDIRLCGDIPRNEMKERLVGAPGLARRSLHSRPSALNASCLAATNGLPTLHKTTICDALCDLIVQNKSASNKMKQLQRGNTIIDDQVLQPVLSVDFFVPNWAVAARGESRLEVCRPKMSTLADHRFSRAPLCFLFLPAGLRIAGTTNISRPHQAQGISRRTITGM
jgi:hypothetical protein